MLYYELFVIIQIMHSLLDGSDVDCVTFVTTVDDISVTGIEVDPIHGYAIMVLLYKQFEH